MKKGRREKPPCLTHLWYPDRVGNLFSSQGLLYLECANISRDSSPVFLAAHGLLSASAWLSYHSRLCYIFWAWNLRDASHTIILIKANANGLSYIKGENLCWHKGLLAGVMGTGQFPWNELVMIRMGTWYPGKGSNTMQSHVWAEEQRQLSGMPMVRRCSRC